MNAEFRELAKACEDGRLDIRGKQYSKAKAIRNSLIGILSVLIGGYLIWRAFRGSLESTEFDTYRIVAFLIGTFLLSFGVWVPSGHCDYLDLRSGLVVNQGWYGIWPPTIDERQFTEFSRIVVRHVCHPGGEGEDTFTGSVGLKPKGTGPVVWLNEFPATKDEMPTVPHRYASELSALIGLPYDL